MSNNPIDVIIAGAGPVGLFLACELATAGVSVLILERESAPSSPSPWKTEPLGRRGLNVPSVEAFYRRDLLDKVIKGARPTHLEKTGKFQFAGHFAGIMMDANKLDLSRWKYHLPGPAALPGSSSIEKVEAALTERAEVLGVQILRDTGISRFVDEGEMVRVWAENQRESFTAQYLVGCDGGRSTVRKLAAFDFVGTEAEFTGYVTLCELDKPELLPPMFNITDTGMYIVGGPGNIYVVDFDADAPFDRSKDITREDFEKVLRRVSGKDVRVTALHLASSFTDRSKQATTYRKGRILLAGDAAHIHSPLGAQGLNAGIGDAVNLGWKLAATINGSAPPGLLDTYHSERHPAGAWVLEWTRAQVAALRPDLFGKAILKVTRDLINTEEGTTYYAGHFMGLSQRYDLGDVHPLVGCSVPEFEFVDGVRLGTKLAASVGRFAVVDFENHAAVAELAKGLGSQIDYIGLKPKDDLGLKMLLVRPDGIVAWVTESEASVDAVKATLSRWLNVPEVA